MPKSFSEPDGNQLTPGPDDNLAPGNESVDGWVSDDCSIYSPSNNSEEDLESDDENCNTPEERKFIVFESQLLSPFTFCPQSGKIITTKRKNTQGSMLTVKRVLAKMQ